MSESYKEARDRAADAYDVFQGKAVTFKAGADFGAKHILEQAKELFENIAFRCESYSHPTEREDLIQWVLDQTIDATAAFDKLMNEIKESGE